MERVRGILYVRKPANGDAMFRLFQTLPEGTLKYVDMKNCDQPWVASLELFTPGHHEGDGEGFIHLMDMAQGIANEHASWQGDLPLANNWALQATFKNTPTAGTTCELRYLIATEPAKR